MPIRPTLKDSVIGSAEWFRQLHGDVARSTREREERERLEQTNPRIVITMVHGTWARSATWVNPDSRFGWYLRHVLTPALVIPFRWSGRNSVKARSRAWNDLRAHINWVRETYPNARHALVAHSHGGNVVLSALADKWLAERTLGVATLGTPFLSAELREDEPLFGPVDGFVAAMFSGIAVFAIGAALGHGRSWWLAGLATWAGVALVLLGASYAASWMQRHARRVRDRMPGTSLTASQLAIVRTSADEAAAALSGARVAGGFASIFWSMASGRVVEWLRQVLQGMDYFGIRTIQDQVMKRDGSAPERFQTSGEIATKSARDTVVPLLPTLVLMMLDDNSALTRWFGAVLGVGYGLPALGALIVSVLSIPFSMIFALGLLPCGWTLPFAGPYLDLTAEPAPPGTWSVTQLRASGEDSLPHGRSHDDAVAIDYVCEWLKGRLTAAEGSEPAPLA